ncbi:MAG: hypothetical protein CMH63_00620 [Nanoarchaeota archaeon]|nr:hypothetical protein [Nanoarchaeota archaeon]|tara:strand:- start:3518 stop:4393 length:876 start_codon:yes stop_codon:yes gene_type:complete
MTKSNERKNLQDKFGVLRRELTELRKKLNIVGPEKEKWFKRKEDLKKEVSSLIKEVKEKREKKEEINSRVKNLKEKRETKNKEVKEKIEKVKTLKENVLGSERRSSPGVLKKQIEDLELKIETEALKFSEEKKLMKKISKLRQEYKKIKEDKALLDEKFKANEDINMDKKIAEEFHKQVQDMAKKGKKEYNSYLELSQKIKTLNSEQEKAFECFLKSKKGFNKVSKNLKNKLGEVSKIKKKLDEVNQGKKEKEKEKQEKDLEEKSQNVEEKLKKGEKLTNEDLIKFQGSKD